MWYNNTGGREAYSYRSDMPTFQGARTQRPKKIWDPYLLRNGLTYSDEIWYGNTR